MAQRYGVQDLKEAKTCLAEPTLRRNRGEAIVVISNQLQQPDLSLEKLMASSLDAAKTTRCCSLFEAAGLASASPVLNRLGQRCTKTQALLTAPAAPPLA
jgi:uncharacterized protein (DUF1810 family)